MEDENTWLTIREAAKQVDYSVEYIRQLARESKIRSVRSKHLDTLKLVNMEDLRRYWQEHHVQGGEK